MIEAIKEIEEYVGDKKSNDSMNENIYSHCDFLYNNGLVNLFFALRDSYFKEKGVSLTGDEARFKSLVVNLSGNGLSIRGSFMDGVEFYRLLRGFFYSFVFQDSPKNKKKGYYAPKKDGFKVAPVLSPVQRFQRVVRAKDELPTWEIDSGYVDTIDKRFEEFKKSNPEIKNADIWYGKRKKEKVFIYATPEELGKRAAQKIREINKGVKNEGCVICGSEYTDYNKKNSFEIESRNLIFDFGSNTSFKDMRTNKQLPICFMCDLIYKYGLLYNFFNDNTHFIISTPLLVDTIKIKERLNISNKPISESNDRSNFVKSKDGKFFVSGEYSGLLLLLYKIYEKLIKKDPDEIGRIIVHYFTATSMDISDSGTYTKTSYIAKFFKDIEGITYPTYDKEGRENRRWFFGRLVNYMNQKDLGNAKNLLKEEFCYRILNCQFIDDLLVDISYYNLQTKEKGKDKKKQKAYPLNLKALYDFNKKYNGLLKMDEKIKRLHEAAKEVGAAVGSFSVEIDNKAILYQLREIEKYEGLTEFFKDFEYEVLKVKDEKKREVVRGLLGGVKERINEVLEETRPEDIRVVRNYLAVYAIQKYLSKQYAKSKQGGG